MKFDKNKALRLLRADIIMLRVMYFSMVDFSYIFFYIWDCQIDSILSDGNNEQNYQGSKM